MELFWRIISGQSSSSSSSLINHFVFCSWTPGLGGLHWMWSKIEIWLSVLPKRLKFRSTSTMRKVRVIQPDMPCGVPAKSTTSATMACRKRQVLLGLFLFLCLISHFLVLSSIFHAFINPPLNSSVLLDRREARHFWCLHPAWNLRAVIWFHLSVCSLVILPRPVAPSVFSFFLWVTGWLNWQSIGLKIQWSEV